MSESSIDKNNIDNLLNALSTSEALEMFSEIDKRIVQLLQCSSDDFLGLNDHFKNAYKESKIISQNAGAIIQLISDVNAQQQFKKLTESAVMIEEIASEFKSLVGTIEIDLKKTSNKYETFNVSFNGIKQNLNSLKLLIANHKILEIKEDSVQIIKGIDECIVSFKKQLITATETFDNFNHLSEKITSILSNIKKNETGKIESYSTSLKHSFNSYIEKHTQSIELSPALKERTEKCSAHIAKIITNLQYHDIIRQKIEHIQGTHKDIVNELNLYAEQEPSQAILHSRVKTFLKIRDIAGLQAAQLLHANKQYQLAIEEISVSLEEIINEMLAISQLGSDLHRIQSNDLFFNTQAQFLTEATLNGDKLKEVIADSFISVEDYLQSGEILEKVTTLIIQEIDNIINWVNKLINISEGVLKEQYALLSDDFGKNKTNYQLLTADIVKKLNSIKELNQSFKNKNADNSPLINFISLAPNIIKELKENGNQVGILLSYNEDTSIRISNEIKTSLHNVKYYVLFEKVCEAIIEQLNELNLKLNYGDDTFASHSREQNLKQLKERYTMASEHLIHEQITRSISEQSKEETENSILNIAPNENSEADDDNLELF